MTPSASVGRRYPIHRNEVAGSRRRSSIRENEANTGVADAAHISVSPSVAGIVIPTGIGIDLNLNNLTDYAGAGIRIFNHSSGGNGYGRAIDIRNTGADLSPQVALTSDGNNLWIMPIDDSHSGNYAILVRDSTFIYDKFSVTLDGAVMAAKSVGQNSVTWTSGSGAPSGSCATGSLYTNKSASSSSTVLYACISGAWVAK